jgi:two-component system, LytTR family, sensor kinase
MKKILLITLLSHLSYCSFGQINSEKYSIGYADDAKKQAVTIITAIPDNGIYSIGLERQDAYSVQRDTAFEAQFGRTNIFERLDSSEVHLFVWGIFKANAKDYEFRVTENKTNVIVDWQTIRQFAADSVKILDFDKGMGYLGAYKTTWNNYIVVEIRKKETGKIIESLVIYWRQIKPVLLNIYTNDEINQFLSKAQQSFPLKLSDDEKRKWTSLYMPKDIDTNSFLPKKLLLKPNEQNVIFLLNASTFPSGALEYKVIKDNEVLTDWQPNDNYNNYIRLKNLEHGTYKLLMRLIIQRQNVTEYLFTVQPKWYQSNRFLFILGTLAVFVPALVIGLFAFFKQRQKLKKQQLQNEKIGQELRAIRSQLNPHFVFNALNSIQGLMNKNDLTNANYYLSEFSTLLRESLLNNEKEYVPLSIELKTLETYIKLEQLRFPFAYSVAIDTQLDTHSIDIPYLLLQPLVENAIKHGLSNLYEKGVLVLHIYPQKDALIVEIKDNGKGFDTEAATNGYGLKLTKERVRLLSAANEQQPVKLLIESDAEKGTTAYLVFRNWL